MVNYFCGKCGKNIENNEILTYKKYFLCSNCYNQKYPLFNIESEYKIYICSNCNAYLFNKTPDNAIFNTEEGDLITIIGTSINKNILNQLIETHKITFELEFDQDSLKKSNGNYILCDIRGFNEDRTIQKDEKIKIHIKYTTCPKCAKIQGKRFDSVIQLRCSALFLSIIEEVLEDLQRYMKLLWEEHNDLIITEIVKQVNGYDLHLSNKALLKKIETYLSERYYFIKKLSKTLVGRNSQTGGDLYRPYLLIKIIPIKEGDAFRLKETTLIIKKIFSKTVQIENQQSGDLKTENFDFFETRNLKYIGRFE